MELIDLTGQRFGRLTVLRRGENKVEPSGNVVTMWECVCDCNPERTFLVNSKNLRTGHTRSCGCYKSSVISNAKKKHGKSHDRVYIIWKGIKNRCFNRNEPKYPNYGGRGISVCSEWLGENGAKNFIEWSMANGYRDDLTINRIDNDGDYCPGNCSWATYSEQANNTRYNRVITYKSETHTLSEWCNMLNIPYKTIWRRLENGWDVSDAFELPIKN